MNYDGFSIKKKRNCRIITTPTILRWVVAGYFRKVCNRD
jgi:hypothetical protein